jgi:hypothetical protein
MTSIISKRPSPIAEYHKKYRPGDFRCAGCKAAVDPINARWRMGFNGWEHACPDHHPQAGHCPSERIPAEAVATG